MDTAERKKSAPLAAGFGTPEGYRRQDPGDLVHNDADFSMVV